MKNSIESLSHKIHDNINRRQKGFITPFISELKSIDAKLFIIYNFQHFPKTYVFELMIEFKHFMQKLTFDDWIEIAYNLQEKKNALIYFVSFISKFIKIDFLNLLIKKKLFSEELNKWLKIYFEKRISLQNFGLIEQKMLEFHNSKISDFYLIKDLFIREGAIELNNCHLTSFPLPHKYIYDTKSKNYIEKEKSIQFTNISIVGRVYFGIKSLENSLRKENRLNDKWSWILNILWSYCENSIKKGRWHRIMSEICPDAVLEEASYESKDIMTVSYNYYRELQLLYLNTPSHINKIIEYIFDIGTIDLYGSIRDDSPITIECCENLLVHLVKNNIEIPDVNFLYGTIKDNRGWGYPVSREGQIRYGEEDIKSIPLS